MNGDAIVLYGRPECHLCDEAEAAIGPVAQEHSVAVEFINIEHDDALHRRYLERIPVICWRGEEIAQLDDFRLPGFADRLRELVRDSY